MPLDAGQIEITKSRWADGRSLGAIAAELKTTIGTIAGKLTRLGLMGRGDRPQGASNRGIKIKFKAPSIVPEPEPVSADIGVSFDDLREFHCRWPSGDPSDLKTFRYCGAQKAPGCSYCAGHARISYRVTK